VAKTEPLKVDVIGAGASGLAAAYYLSESDRRYQIRVWEKDETPGGLAGTFSSDDFSVEKFYHHIFRRDTGLQSLISELGLTEQLMWKAASTGSYYFNQPFRLSSPLDLLKFKPLPLADRFRLGLMVLRARMVKDWTKLDDISVAEYVTKIAGTNVFKTVWEPLLKGKFGATAENISAAWLWAKLVDRGSSRNKTGFEELGYVKGGLSKVFDKIVRILKEKGHEVNLGHSVDALEIENNKISTIRTSKGAFDTELVVSAAQLPDLARILPDSVFEYKERIGKIGFLGNVCLILILKESLSKFYWTNVTDPAAPFVGIVEQTNWADTSEFGSKHLVYISAYLPEGDKRYQMGKAELLNFYLPSIKKMFPTFNEDTILDSYLWSARYAQPVVQTGYRHLIPELQSPVENLYVSTMAQIYPSDRQVSNGIDMAKQVVEIINSKTSQEGPL